MSKWKASILFRRFEKVFCERISWNVEALSWKHIRKKADLLIKIPFHILLFLTKVTVSTVAIRFINGSYNFLHLKSCSLSWTVKWICKADIIEILNFNFFSYTIILLLLLRNIMVICYEELLIEEWNYSSFLWGSYQHNGGTYTELFINVHSKVKSSIENTCYNVTVKLFRESEDIIAATCACPARSIVKCLGKCKHVGAILFALEDFN